MTDFLSHIQLHQVRCDQHDEVANFICLEKQCQKRGLSCPLCEQIHHKDHVFKPLKYFLSQLTQPQSISNSLALISAQIDSTLLEIQSQFAKTTSAQDRAELSKAYSTYLTQLNKKINNEFEIDKQLKDFFETADRLTFKQINQFVNKFELHEYEPETPPPKPLTNQEKYLYQMLQMLKDKNDDLTALLKAKSDIKDILGLFIFSQVKQKMNFIFSQQLHHTSIKITDKLTAKQQHNYSSNFALIEPMIMGKKKSFEKKTIKIKIDKLNSWINLGVCIKSKTVASSYYLNTQDVGHGAYTVSNDGYSWHNVDSSLNSHYHGWNFAQGDVVTMTYDPKAKIIKYTKENTDKEYELACEPVSGEQMYFCCTLNTHDECVSIVQ